jgi:hypothetical protein
MPSSTAFSSRHFRRPERIGERMFRIQLARVSEARSTIAGMMLERQQDIYRHLSLS